MGENTRKDRRTKVLSMTVRYRSATLGEFIEHHSYDVSRGGMFIKTPSPFPPGTLLKFEVKIAEEQRVMQGVGRVVWKRDLDGDSPDDPAGMGIKFIKIDDASRAVIDKLVEGRPPGQEGAFEHLPDAKPRMFPSTPPPAQAVTEDPTVVKPAAELLKDALRKTGEGEVDSVPPPSSRVSGVGAALSTSNAALGAARATAETADLDESFVKRASSEQVTTPSKLREGSKRDSAKDNDARAQTSGAKPTAPSKEEEEGRGRALLSILIALLVAAGIYFLTKQSNQPASRPSPPAPAPVVEQAPLPPTSSAELVAPVPDAALSTTTPFELEPVPAVSTVDAPVSSPAPDPEPVAAPKPAPVRAPKPRPTPKPPTATTSASATLPTPATAPATSTPPVPVQPAPAPTAPSSPGTQSASEAPAAP